VLIFGTAFLAINGTIVDTLHGNKENVRFSGDGGITKKVDYKKATTMRKKHHTERES
jgi:hypothetical protein